MAHFCAHAAGRITESQGLAWKPTLCQLHHAGHAYTGVHTFKILTCNLCQSCCTLDGSKPTIVTGVIHTPTLGKAYAMSSSAQVFYWCHGPQVLCRSHWLLALQQEWEASMEHETDVGLQHLGQARQHRCRLEALHDVACRDMVNKHAADLGATVM